MINFNATKKDTELITKIVQRTVKMNADYDYMDASMDISAVHLNDCKLDLKKLLGCDKNIKTHLCLFFHEEICQIIY